MNPFRKEKNLSRKVEITKVRLQIVSEQILCKDNHKFQMHIHYPQHYTHISNIIRRLRNESMFTFLELKKLCHY